MLSDGERELVADAVIAATGFRPDLTLLGELRLDLDDRAEAARELAPLSCGSVPPHGVDELSHPDRGIYIVGMKSYGRAPIFLLRTGCEQVRSIVAALAGDWEAARRVDLVLPETGVCNRPVTPAATPESGAAAAAGLGSGSAYAPVRVEDDTPVPAPPIEPIPVAVVAPEATASACCGASTTDAEVA